MRTVKFGIIGGGGIAHAFADACKGLNYPVTAVVSRRFDRAKAFAEKHHIANVYETIDAFLKQADMDCVYIATPHNLHYEQMLAAIAHKKHILCEKAFTLNEKQAAHVFDLAKQNNVFVMEAMWTRFLPLTKHLQHIINRGDIGEITQFDAHFGFVSNEPADHRHFNLDLAGGVLLDVGIYPLNYAHIFLGNPNYMDIDCKKHATGVDSDCKLTLHYPNKKAYLQGSFIKNLSNDAKIIGKVIFISLIFGVQLSLHVTILMVIKLKLMIFHINSMVMSMKSTKLFPAFKKAF